MFKKKKTCKGVQKVKYKGIVWTEVAACLSVSDDTSSVHGPTDTTQFYDVPTGGGKSSLQYQSQEPK